MAVKNDHLIPQMILDIGSKVSSATDNEKFNIVARLEAIRDFCAKTIQQAEKGNGKH